MNTFSQDSQQPIADIQNHNQNSYFLPQDNFTTPNQHSPAKQTNNVQEQQQNDYDESMGQEYSKLNNDMTIKSQQHLSKQSPKKLYEQKSSIQNSIQSTKSAQINQIKQQKYNDFDKENSDYLMQQYNIPAHLMSQQQSSIKKSSSQADIINGGTGANTSSYDQDYSIANPCDQDQYEDNNSQGNQSYVDNLTQNTDGQRNSQIYDGSQQSTNQKKKIGKRSQSKDVKILQTMKAYFPQLAPTEQKKAALIQQQASNPMLQKVYGGNGQRSNTQGQGKSKGQHSERIIFVENRRKPLNQDNSTIDYKNRQSVERRNSQINNSINAISQKQVSQTTKNVDQLRKNTQLPPINKRSQIQVLDQQQASSSTGIFSPLSTNQYQNNQQQYQQNDSQQDRQRLSNKFGYTSTSDNNPVQELYMVNGVILEGNYDSEQRQNQQRIDFERKNQEMIQRMQEKKSQEMKMIEDQRRKLQKKQEKLKNMILKQAADLREKKLREEEEMKKKQLEESNNGQQKKTPKKIKPYIPQPTQQQIMLKQMSSKEEQKQLDGEKLDQEDDEEKKKMDMLKKYYRSRYSTFLKAIQEKNKKRDEEMEIQKKKEEKRKAKLQEELGIKTVQSRFMEDVVKLSKEATEKVVIEELPKKKPNKDIKRGNSIAGLKSMTSTSNFNHTTTSSSHNNNDSVSEIQKIYIPQSQDGGRRSRSGSKSHQRALTPKVKKSKRVIVMPIDEKTEEEFEKEQKAKKEAAEKIKQRQQKYLQELQERKEKESLKMEEERKKKEKLLQQAREQAKQNFDKVANQPGLKELQDKQFEKKQQSSQEDDNDNNGEDTEKKKKKKQKKVENTQGSQLESFLERNNPKKVIFPNITDMATWKKKYKVDDNVKVFICTGGYPDIKKALKRRGWVENKDTTSPCFDFKWVLKSKDIDHNTLNDQQLVNHFNKATAITTKVGLCHNLKNLIWFNNVDIDTFYPRCFDLAMQEDLDDFIDDFKGVKAESFVKQFVREMRESMGDKASTVSDKVLKVALKVCEKRLKDLDELIDDPTAFSSLVTDEEWAILGADEHNPESLAKQKHENWMAKNEVMQQEKKKLEKKQKDADKKQKQKKKKVKKQTVPKEDDGDEDYERDEDFEGWESGNKKKDEDNNDDEEEDIIDDEDDGNKAKVEEEIDMKIMNKHPEYKRALKVLEGLKAKFPQFNLNGEKNIWIIKPAGSSRGRGIVLYRQLIEILDLCKQKESQYIAQKYIENSLIVKSRKFDIRQWVLVTDWNPLTVWVYQEPYFRFPASDYNPDNILDRFIHLTNNSVAKYAEGTAKVSHEIDGNMWTLDEMRTHLQEEYGWDVWEDKLKESTKNIIINCLESVQDMFECKPGCFELFGFDLMIDEDFNMWLIEVNSSPAMDYSTSVTERLVKLVLEDTIKVVVDYAQAKKKSKVDTGLFECVYKAQKIVDKPSNSFGLNLVLEGKKMAPSKVAQY